MTANSPAVRFGSPLVGLINARRGNAARAHPCYGAGGSPLGGGRALKPTVSLRRALDDPALLGWVLPGPSWLAWRALLIATMGEPLIDVERDAFRRLTGRDQEPLERCEEFWGVAGRRGGKTRAAATQAVYLAALCDHRENLAIGERGLVLFIAQNQRQASVAFDYAAGIFDAVPLLGQLVIGRTSDTLSLSGGIDLEVRASSFRGLRGPTCVAVIGDEVAFWFSDDCANPDTEILNAVRPMLTRLCLRPTSCMGVRGYCRWTPVEPAGTCPDYKSSKLDGSGDPWTTGAYDERWVRGPVDDRSPR
jgi:hypothetical protein